MRERQTNRNRYRERDMPSETERERQGERKREREREIVQKCHLFSVRGDCKCVSIKIIQNKDAVYVKCNIFAVYFK